MAELIKLTEIQSPDLINFNTNQIIAEIIDRIQRHPEWNELWNGELKQNALYVIINIFAYLFSKNAEVANRLIKENFILLAKDPNNITNIMANYGLRIRSNTHSIANIKVMREDGGILTSDLVLSGVPGNPFSVTSSGSIGGNINFEIYEKDEYGKVDYFKPIILRKGMVNNLVAYSGTTSFETVSVDSQEKKEKFFYRLNNSPVIEDSVKVYYNFNNQNLELAETDSFTMPASGDTDRFPGGQPYYKVSYSSTGSATIVFGTQFFGGSFPKNEIGELRIYYRHGGGASSNVPEGGINYTTTVNNTSFIFSNTGDSGGGVDVEDLNLAKFYAPMRVGRGKQIVDERDSLLALAGMTVKHKVVSPKYSILPNKESVPILHYYNYIVPNRTFSDFTLPTPDTNDTADTYEYKMRAALNQYLNLSKIHDGPVIDEAIVSEYTETNIQYPLKYKPILSGTLVVSAYDHYNLEIDRLTYSSSYYGETNVNDKNTSTAKLRSYNRITDGSFNLNDRNQFDFEMDGILLEITIPSQINGVNIQYTSPESLAQTINQLIIQKIKNSWTTINPLLLIPVGQNYITLSYNYFYYLNNYFYLNSPTIGANSSLKLIIDSVDSVRNRFLSLIKLTGAPVIANFTYAVPESRKIFLDNSNFNYVNNSLDIKINLDDIDRSKDLSEEITIAWPNRNLITGPSFSYPLRDYNLRKIYLKQNSNFNLEVYENGVIKDRILFESVAPGQITPGVRQETKTNGDTISGQVEIFKESTTDISGVYKDTYFDYDNSLVYFSLNDSDEEQLSAPYSFPRESFINSLFDNSISDAWVQYDDGIEAVLPVDGYGKKYNFISNNFIFFPSPDPASGNNIPTGWQYYYDTYNQTNIVIEEQESTDENNWYYTTISYEQKTLVPRVDGDGNPVLDDNGAQIIDESWLSFTGTIFLKVQYDLIVLDISNYRSIIVGTLVKPLVQVPIEIITAMSSPEIIDGEGDPDDRHNNKFYLTKNNTKYQIEKKQENALGIGVSYHFEIADENTNSQLKLKFNYNVFSGDGYISDFVDGDLKTYIIAEDENHTIVYQEIAIISGSTTFEVTWNSINFKNYRLAFHVTNASTNKYKILFENVQIYQEPIDTTYYLELLTDNIDGLVLYKPETDLITQIARGQGVAYDVSLSNYNDANVNFAYEVTDGTYNDALGVSIFGIKLVNNTYTYTLLNLNDNYSVADPVQLYEIKLNNINNNKVSVNFNTSNYERFRIVFHTKHNQTESFSLNINNITIGIKPLDFYNENFYFKIDYSREKFNTIKCNYEPHPYFQEDETMGFLDVLKNQNKRIIGIEPLIKKVNFNPLGINLLLTFSTTAQVENVLNNIEETIVNNYSYNNTNENIKIGEIFSLDLINNKLVETFANYGLVGAKITDINSLLDESPIGNDYYFICPPVLATNLKTLEIQYPNIVGIADKYEMKVSYLKL